MSGSQAAQLGWYIEKEKRKKKGRLKKYVWPDAVYGMNVMLRIQILFRRNQECY